MRCASAASSKGEQKYYVSLAHTADDIRHTREAWALGDQGAGAVGRDGPRLRYSLPLWVVVKYAIIATLNCDSAY